MFLFVLGLILIHTSQSNLLQISTVVANTSTVIACGSSIDIYPIFDPAQVIICPYLRLEEEKIQWIYLNICKMIVFTLFDMRKFICFSAFDSQTDQLVIYSNPPFHTLPNILIKSPNNSLISPSNFSETSIYYLSFSPELSCRYHIITNETLCFYYPISTNFLSIEYHYDQIRQGSLKLPIKARHRFYIIFIIIGIFSLIICILAVCIICTHRSTFYHPTPFDLIIDRHVARQEAAKRPPDPLQDGVTGHPLNVDQREAHVFLDA